MKKIILKISLGFKLINKIKIWLHYLNRRNQITKLDITLFLRQFATLIAAGIPIIKSCELLEKSQEKITLRSLIRAIKKEILTGKTLSYSLTLYPNHFDKMTYQLVKIGEHTGKLDTMLVAIANQKEKSLAFNKRIKQTLFYPSIIMITALVITFSMFIFVIPRFVELFQDTQTKLPLLTICIFYLSIKFKQYFVWWVTIIFLFALILFFNKQSTYHKHAMRVLLSLPLIKKCVHKIILVRFTRNLAMTFAAGIPIIDALKLSANASGNLEFVDIIAKLRSKICAGLQLHHAMESFSYFPPLMIQMVKVGEEAGKIEYMLDKIADFLESDIDQLFCYISQLLEPLIMVILGVLIGGLVIGMYLPIFKLGSAL